MQHTLAIDSPSKECLLVALLSVTTAFGQARAGGLDPREIYRKVEASVVAIEAVDPAGKVVKSGSGFLVGSDGKFLTNYHVVAHVKQATVRLANGDAYDTVEVVAVDKRKDIALLKIQAVELPYLTLGRSASVEIGDAVYSVSNPLGAMLQNTLSQGLVSGKREMDGYRVFQISAPISHGSSGGPIFNTSAEVVGIAAFMLEGGQNLNFAIPIDYARGMLTANNLQPLSSIYEPEPVPQPPAAEPKPSDAPAPTSAAVRTPNSAVPAEMKDVPSGIFLERQIRKWTSEDAERVLGQPFRHRYSYDNQKNITGDIFAYPDPTGLYREFELLFDQSKKLQIVYIFPYAMTWDQCKGLWGDDVVITKNADGTRFYTYKKRRLAVYVQKNGTVISYYVF
jgi:hypothetical protein